MLFPKQFLPLLGALSLLLAAPLHSVEVFHLGEGDADTTFLGEGMEASGNLPDRVGENVAAGDVNGDGLTDLVITALNWSGPDLDRANAGAVLILFGGAPGSIRDLRVRPPDVVIHSPRDAVKLGQALVVEDLDGDGTDDIAASLLPRSYWADATFWDWKGRVLVFRGRPDWPDTWDLATTPPDTLVLGAASGDQIGAALATGDLTGDGIADLAIGAPVARMPSLQRAKAGHVFLLEGGTDWPGTWNLKKRPATMRIVGPQRKDRLGASLAIFDFDGDGLQDLMMGASTSHGPGGDSPDKSARGAVFVLYGGRPLRSLLDLQETPPDASIFGKGAFHKCGSALAGGDFNGDGAMDLAVGCPGLRGNQLGHQKKGGAVDVIAGGRRLPPVVDPIRDQIFARRIGDPTYNDLRFGKLILGMDLNGDGIDDLCIQGRSSFPNGQNGRYCSVTHVELGGPDLAGVKRFLFEDADITLKHEGNSGGYAAGDLSGDGLPDLIIGSPSLTIPPDGVYDPRYIGGVFVVAAGGPLPAAIDLDDPAVPYLTVYGTRGEHRPYYSSNFGKTAAIGDVDGDGFADLVVGSPLWSGPAFLEHQYGRGRLEIFLGDGGPWPGLIDLKDRDPDAVVYGPFENGRLGNTLVVADLNGDGVDDIASAAREYDPRSWDPTYTYVLFGGSAGSSVVDLSADPPDAMLSSRETDMSTALRSGDFDGDGADDLAIRQYGDFGGDYDAAITLVFGGPGLQSVEDLAVPGPGRTVLWGSSRGFGQETVSVGDYDGDGRDDLAVGHYDLPLTVPPEEYRGGAVLFRGRRNWPAELSDTAADLTVVGDNRWRLMGTSVLLADLTGDGMDELLLWQRRPYPKSPVFRIVRGGPFADPVRDLQLDPADSVLRRAEGLTSFRSQPIHGGDFTGDGADELVITLNQEIPAALLVKVDPLLPSVVEVGEDTALAIFHADTSRYSMAGSAAATLVGGTGQDLILYSPSASRDPADSSTWDAGAVYVLYNDCGGSPCDVPFESPRSAGGDRAAILYRSQDPDDVTDPNNLLAESALPSHRDAAIGNGILYFYEIGGAQGDDASLHLERDRRDVVLDW
jgi:hypothetical protein